MEYLSVLIKFIKFWEWGKPGDVWCCFTPCSLKKDTHTVCTLWNSEQLTRLFSMMLYRAVCYVFVQKRYRNVYKCKLSSWTCACMYVLNVRGCVCVCPGTKESSGSSVAGREQINSHRARMLPHSLRHRGMGVCKCACTCGICVYILEEDRTNK